MRTPTILPITSRTLICFSVAILLASCGKTTPPDSADDGASSSSMSKEQLQSYQPFADKLNEIQTLQAKQAQAEDYEQKYLKLEKQFLVRMANLNSRMSEWGHLD